MLVTGQRRATILTSATLTVEGRFDYVKERLGLHDADELSVPSEFDYARQTLLYLPRRMPRPARSRFAEAVAREAGQLLRCSHGRAFVLFTSYATLRAVAERLEPELEYPMLVQGTAPRCDAARPSSAARRTRCCWPPRASGRASTWWATR